MTHTPTRRLLALLLAVATVFSLLSMSVSAADEQTGPELKLVSTATEPLKKGDSFTVEVQFPKDAEFSNFELYFDFDLTQFKLVSVNTKYKVTIGNKEYEIPYVEDMLMVVKTDSVEYNGKTYGGSIATASAGTEEQPNVTASEGVLFTLTFEVLKCNAEQQNISIFSKLFQKSTTLSDFEDITPVITPARITIGHTLTAVPAKNATCTEDGNTAYWKCSACEKWFSDADGTNEIADKDSVVTKATGHKYQETVDEKYLKSAATCTSPAIYYKSCSVCGAASTETFEYGEKASHNYVQQHDAEKHWEECSVCHTKTNEAAHSGGEATCTAKAVCSTCGAAYGELAAHNYQETVDAQYLKSAATCTSPAIYYKSCSVCGTASEETFTYGTTTEHSYELKHDAEKHWEECSVCHTKTNEAAHSGGEATCTAKAVCSTCGAAYGELAAHNYQETVDAQYLKSAATCTSPAIYYKSCSVCGTASEETFTYGTTTEHSYELKHDAEKHWEECSVCHAKTNEAVHSGGTATCIAKAVCSVCHTEYGTLAEHDAVHHDRVDPTCTTTGSIEYWQCGVCGKKFSDAACTTEATDVTLTKLPHSAGTAWEKDTTYHWHLCVNCGSEVMDKAAHTYGDWVTVTEATETEAGLRKRTCSVCGYEQTEEISMLRFTVTVRNGSGSGEYKSGETVTITADRRSGYTFEKWTVDSGNVTLAKETDSTTTFTMPAENVTVTATYRYNGGSGSGSGSSSGIVIKDENGKVLGKADPDTGIVELPITPVPAASSSRQAEELEITIPKNTTVKVEIPVRNVTPGTVVVIVHADGTEEIVRTSVVTKKGVALELTGSATVKVYDNSKFFTDVPAANWASDAVAFASSRELFNGTGANTFSPNAPMTRQMLMTVLARLDGTDTSGNAYAKGMEWAIRNGVSNGSDPEGKITREQLATMLWRYAGNPSVSGRMTGFVDADQISGYAEDAMLWATKAGIIGGKGNGQLDPKGYATRAEVAAMLMRYCNTLFTK